MLYIDRFSSETLTGNHFRDRSPFEHVFVGEVDPKKSQNRVKGLHNWLRFYHLEKNHKISASECLSVRRRFNVLFLVNTVFQHVNARIPGHVGMPRILKLSYTWQGEYEPFSGFILGTSPEFELALYTVIFTFGRDRHKPDQYFEVPVKMAGQKVTVAMWSNGGRLGTAYPKFD